MNAPGFEPGAVLAASLFAHCRALGVVPPPELRLLAWGTDTAERDAATIRVAADLGTLHERLVVGDHRTDRGAWYTPAVVAAELVARTVDRPGTVGDPACGGGAFLLAAADRLVELGVGPAEVVTGLLWGADIDPVAVAVSEAALWLWSLDHGHPVVIGDRLRVADSLRPGVVPPLDAIVGNPPFLGQLRGRTVADEARRAELRRWYPEQMAPYTDVAWLFLWAAVDAAAEGGRVTLVQPQSVLAARDAGPVRRSIDAVAHLEDCWIGDENTFDAAVAVCAPTLRRDDAHAAGTNRWTEALAAAHGVPTVVLDRSRTIGDLAAVHAGFRDEYYDLVDAVREGGAGPRLVTSGAIDPLRIRDDRAIRFAKQAWTSPTVDVAAAGERGRRWVEVQRHPSLLVASQTPVVEAAVDVDGSFVVGVPGVCIVPFDPADLWALAAVLHAPAVTAWVLGRTIGTGMSTSAVRPTAAALAATPLPTDAEAWSEAADLARELHDLGGAAGTETWAAFAAAADRAYGVDADVGRWWLTRLPGRAQ